MDIFTCGEASMSIGGKILALFLVGTLESCQLEKNVISHQYSNFVADDHGFSIGTKCM